MSTIEATLKGFLGFSLNLGDHARTENQAANAGPGNVPQQAVEPVEVSGADTIIAHQSPQGLATLLGKYDNDPSWEEFPAFLEEYRRQIDAMSRD